MGRRWGLRAETGRNGRQGDMPPPTCRSIPRRRILAGVSALPLVLLACGDRSLRTGGGPLDGTRSVVEPAGDGLLSARPGEAEALTTAPAGVHELDLREGRAIVYVPAGYRADRPAPLAVMFHGAGGTAEDGLALLRVLADEAGLLLLAPASRGRTWDLLLDGYGSDVALVDESLQQVFHRYAVDAAHLAAGGFSDGASYALSIGAANGRLFSHVVAFSPGFWIPGERSGSPAFFVTHGTDDPILPIGSTSRRLVPMLRRAGYEVSYHEFEGGHVVPGELAANAVTWFVGDG